MSLEATITDLKSKIGTETHVGPWLTITQERINQFAEATGDTQWIHTDVNRAATTTPFGSTIAHGYLTLSLIPYLTESVKDDGFPYPGVVMGINYGTNKVRFPNPVKTGSKVRSRTELLSFEEVKGGLQIVNKVTIEIEGEPKPACVAETVTRLLFG